METHMSSNETVSATPIFASGDYLAQMCGEIDRLRAQMEQTRAVLDDALRPALDMVEGNYCPQCDEEGAPEPDCRCEVCDAWRLIARAEKLDPTPQILRNWMDEKRMEVPK